MWWVRGSIVAVLAWALSACTARTMPPAAGMSGPPAPAPAPVREAVRVDPASTCGNLDITPAVLRRVNAARAAGRSCGTARMPPAPPVSWNPVLFSVAARHSADMARRDYFDHATPEGRRAAARLASEGYRWRSVAENIAGGDRSVAKVVDGWLDSPSHCRNMLNPEFTEIGVACVERTGSTWGTYWTMLLARPR